VESVYINCHAMVFQSGGRHWLGKYLEGLASEFAGDLAEKVREIAGLYVDSGALLRKFQEFNILDGKTEDEVQQAVTWVEDACEMDEQILDRWEEVRAVLQDR